MQKEKFLIIPNKNKLSEYTKYGFNRFILPLKDYSIGFDVYFSLEEINELSNDYEIYVMANKFLHMKIYEFKDLYNKFNKNVKFIVEDIGLTRIIEKDRLVLYENHILSNYKAINYLKDLDINSVVINNDLTINELEKIDESTNSNLYYFFINKNNIMYSRRLLVSNYNKYFNIDNNSNCYNLIEKTSKEKLKIKEEKEGSMVFYGKIFCASKYISKLNNFNLIINFTDIDEINEKMILENYDSDKLMDLIDSDYYFLENDIKYKVGDIK